MQPRGIAGPAAAPGQERDGGSKSLGRFCWPILDLGQLRGLMRIRKRDVA
jgi:hypothetical protein